MSKYIWIVYLLLSVMSGYIFDHLSVKGLALVFAAILFFRIMKWIRPGGAARYYFCLQLGVSGALIVQSWQHYGWVIGLFAGFAVLFLLPFWTPQSVPAEVQNMVEPDEAPAEDERSYWEKRAGITFTIYKEPDPYFSAGNSSKGNGLTAWFLPELAEGKAAASGAGNDWSFSFIEKSVSAIPGGRYIAPVTLGDAHADRIFAWRLCAFVRDDSGDFGLRHQHACIQFPAGSLQKIAFVEFTCRGSDWYTLLFISANSSAELSFDGAGKAELSLFAMALAEAWKVPLTQRFVNHN
ncbi:hypothetical protein [Klebsiella aerogenes]|uniref:hypothetical protein n=1 Tax=Klebsiella aerogenes TaxID=548 RepID=UPI00292F1B02|nr:hypothetical protein [Klebsiella aerogenes]